MDQRMVMCRCRPGQEESASVFFKNQVDGIIWWIWDHDVFHSKFFWVVYRAFVCLWFYGFCCLHVFLSCIQIIMYNCITPFTRTSFSSNMFWGILGRSHRFYWCVKMMINLTGISFPLDVDHLFTKCNHSFVSNSGMNIKCQRDPHVGQVVCSKKRKYVHLVSKNGPGWQYYNLATHRSRVVGIFGKWMGPYSPVCYLKGPSFITFYYSYHPWNCYSCTSSWFCMVN